MSEARLFVYGTLMQGGFWNTRLFRPYGARLLGTAVLRDYALHEVCPGLPAILPVRDGVVIGEVWSVPNNLVGAVDELEEAYKRTPVTVRLGGHDVPVQTYVWRNRERIERFPGTRWSLA